MILVIGGTGLLGGKIVELLRRQVPVRVLTRRPGDRHREGVEYVPGDLRDADSVRKAVRGVDAVVCTAHGGGGSGADGPRHLEGTALPRLVEAAGGVRQFVYVSAVSARPDSPAELFRLKAGVERALRDTRSTYAVVRATHLLDTWAGMLARPLVAKGQAMILGGGRNPVSWVAADDIAKAATTLVLRDGTHRLDLGGPQTHTLRDLNGMLAAALGVTVRSTMRLPAGALRAASVLMRPFAEVPARQMRLGALLDTLPQVVDSTAAWEMLDITPASAPGWLSAHAETLRQQADGSMSTAAEVN